MKQILTALVFIITSSVISSSAIADDFDDVAATVGKYFEGTEQGRPNLLEEAFLPSLEIQYVTPEGTLGRITAADYISRFKPGAKANRKGRIVSIDLVGTAANVKAEIIMGDRLYTDYLLLLKLDGVWRVSNKVATFRQR